MVSYVELKDFNEFDKYYNAIDPKGPPVYFYFTGKKDDSGKSWCPDCVVAEPKVKEHINNLNKPMLFVYVDVGDVAYWRDKNCPFRTDSRLKLMQIPTIIKYKGVQRLEGTQCSKPDLLQMMFEEEEE
ncbi:hypothetical protein NE865_06064 [Phthorimaea operculella]|nr:hypothetical protein NE865_06064 [Phthorimaea operculella]